MILLDIYSGLLGCGKTTVIKQMLNSTYKGMKVAIIENEIGKVNLDKGEFDLPDMSIREMTAGCVCCTIKGNFTEAVKELSQTLKPDVIILEPTGAADLNALIDACLKVNDVKLNRFILIVNAKKIKALLSVVGEFFIAQIRAANIVYMNFTENLAVSQKEEAKEMLLSINPKLDIVDTPLTQLNEHSFPGIIKEKTPEGRKTSSPLLQVEELGAGTHRRMSFGNRKKLYTWTYQFEKDFTEEAWDKLKAILEDTAHNNLWRAKGFLQMADHTVKKIDLTFGELFEEDRSIQDDERTGTLVLIGEKINVQWLSEKFKELF